MNKNKILIIYLLICIIFLSSCRSIYNFKTDNTEIKTDFNSPENVNADESIVQYDSKSNCKTLAQAVTRLNDKTPNRIHNINLAIESLKNVVIESGQEFSFNTVVGERSVERGYKEAATIIYQERASGVGGGVCQLSTTIYQAVKQADIEIIEHNEHNKKVDYAAKGMDACVEYGKLDFKFRNNTDKTIILKVSCDGEYVYASIESNE